MMGLGRRCQPAPGAPLAKTSGQICRMPLASLPVTTIAGERIALVRKEDDPLDLAFTSARAGEIVDRAMADIARTEP